MKIILIAILNLFFGQIAFSQNTMMVIHKKFGLKDSILVSEVTKVTFHPVTGTNFVNDIDGNVYRTVIIGNKEWMVENLRTTHLNDGTPIPFIGGQDWRSMSTMARWAYNDTFVDTYGYLYNGFSVGTGKLAPLGWRVTTLGDWLDLESIFGKHDSLIAAIYEPGNLHWTGDNSATTNQSGLTLLPVGNYQGFTSEGVEDWYGEGRLTDFWLSGPPFIIRFEPYGYWTEEYFGYTYFGISVRCVRDVR